MSSIAQLQKRTAQLILENEAKEKTIKALRFQLKEYELHIDEMTDDERDSLYSQIDHLHRSLVEQSQVVTMYQQWFTRNAYWTQLHNNMMKYNPALGNYQHRGADEPIVIPEVEQWEVVKHIPPLSPVAEPDEEV